MRLDILDRKPKMIKELKIDEECQTDLDFEQLEDDLEELDHLRDQVREREEQAALNSAQQSSRGNSKRKKKGATGSVTLTYASS